MVTYKCPSCGYTYDLKKGDPDSKIEPGTLFEDLPDNWVCPVCGAVKDLFKMIVIECDSLTKKFDADPVLNSITLEVEEGTVFGILGTDGSGKTTLLKLLTGLLNPTSGTCFLLGENVSKDSAKALHNVGCLVGEPAFYHYLTAGENLQLFADLMVTDTRESTSISFGNILGELLTCSMKKQLGIALALQGDPCLLLLDEPLANLDSKTRKNLKNVLQSEAEEKTILFTTNNPQDIEDLAVKAAVLKKGEITAQGPVKTLHLNQVTEVEE